MSLPSIFRSHFRAFSLLELLVVIGILMVVTSIGVYNMLDAQTRSKTSRAMADIRALAVAVESYNADHQHYPIPFPSVKNGAVDNNHGDRIPNELSSPVAYIQNVRAIKDPFAYTGGPADPDLHRYGFLNTEIKDHACLTGANPLTRENLDHIGRWRLDSVGPDIKSPDWPNEASFDATNGTVSRGDIYRTQIEGKGEMKGK